MTKLVFKENNVADALDLLERRDRLEKSLLMILKGALMGITMHSKTFREIQELFISMRINLMYGIGLSLKESTGMADKF